MRHTLRRSLFSPVLVLLLGASLQVHAVASEATSAEDDSAYTAGTRAMNEHRWADAVASFDRVVDAKDKKADAALYWKAYSLNKLDKSALAQETCVQLRTQFGASQWNKDCSALTLDLRSEGGMPPMPAIPPIPAMPPINFRIDLDGGSHSKDPNAELKILALNSLLNRDPAQAIPLLRGMLTGNQPDGIKKHAIFVLEQSKSPEAQSILHDVVLGKMGLDLQREAIQMSAVFQGKRGNDALAEVYRSTTDAQIKRSIISAFFISQDAPRMVELARNEKDMNLKRSIVSQLALMNDKAATAYMMELLK
ncbi:MAG: hypothetical protein NVSMB3_00130 [Acidobacteriaceae bacterium]